MKTITINELKYLLSISREEAKSIIETANEDLWLHEYEGNPMEGKSDDETRSIIQGRNYARIEYISRVVPKVNSTDPRYHNRSILDIILEGLKKGMSLRMKMELRAGIHIMRNKTLRNFASESDKKIPFV